MRVEVGAAAPVLLLALFFDAFVLAAFTAIKLKTDPMIVIYAIVAIAAVFVFERSYMTSWIGEKTNHTH